MAICALFGLSTIRLAIQIIVHAGGRRGEEEVEDGAVDAHVDAAMSISIQGVSRNSSCGWNASFLPSEPKIASRHHEER